MRWMAGRNRYLRHQRQHFLAFLDCHCLQVSFRHKTQQIRITRQHRRQIIIPFRNLLENEPAFQVGLGEHPAIVREFGLILFPAVERLKTSGTIDWERV